MNIAASSQAERLIGKRYEENGYAVTYGPQRGWIPFDLGSYTPDILAVRGNENLLIEVKSKRSPVDIDRYRLVDEEVQRHPGWRFLIVTAPDPELVTPQSSWPDDNVSAEKIERVLQQIDKIRAVSDLPALVLPQLWTAYIAALRLISPAQHNELPLSDLSFLNQAYSTGLISYEEYESAKTLMKLRNLAAHSLDSAATEADVNILRGMVESALARLKEASTMNSATTYRST
jgi:hypothetical protein